MNVHQITHEKKNNSLLGGASQIQQKSTWFAKGFKNKRPRAETLWFWRRRFFNDPTPILHFCNKSSFTQGWLITSLIEISLLVLEKKIFFNINICKYVCLFILFIVAWAIFQLSSDCKYGFPYCGPSRPPGTMMSKSTLYQKAFM